MKKELGRNHFFICFPNEPTSSQVHYKHTKNLRAELHPLPSFYAVKLKSCMWCASELKNSILNFLNKQEPISHNTEAKPMPIWILCNVLIVPAKKLCCWYQVHRMECDYWTRIMIIHVCIVGFPYHPENLHLSRNSLTYNPIYLSYARPMKLCSHRYFY